MSIPLILINLFEVKKRIPSRSLKKPLSGIPISDFNVLESETKHMNYLTRFTQKYNLFSVLLDFDRRIIAEAAAQPCPHCGTSLHRADYERRVDGIAISSAGSVDARRRFSLCCSKDGCRKRNTPPSSRFLGRSNYSSIVIVLVSILSENLTAFRYRQIRRHLDISKSTLQRWRRGWTEKLPGTPFWRKIAGRFGIPPDIHSLPRSILRRFAGPVPEQLSSLLKLLSPLGSPAEGSMVF